MPYKPLLGLLGASKPGRKRSIGNIEPFNSSPLPRFAAGDDPRSSRPRLPFNPVTHNLCSLMTIDMQQPADSVIGNGWYRVARIVRAPIPKQARRYFQCMRRVPLTEAECVEGFAEFVGGHACIAA